MASEGEVVSKGSSLVGLVVVLLGGSVVGSGSEVGFVVWFGCSISSVSASPILHDR
jgi:hypothetical protein